MAEASGVLGTIVSRKREEVGARFAGVSLDSLRAHARPTRKSLGAALARPGARFILEIKKASPSQGHIRPGADPAALARNYAGVADALSVLTDGSFFGGSRDDLAAARTQFDGPILAKDFFLDPRQVVEARIAGADAVLVMLSLLDDDDARGMIEEARRLGMDALVEVHDEREMRRALALDTPLIGINNRNLADLSVNLAVTERVAPWARGRRLVSESGIAGRADVGRLSSQVDAFLIGTSLMRSADPAQAARELVFGRVKLCGLNRREDIAAGAGASYAGFIFVPGSVRRVTAARAAPLADHARKAGILPVGVYRDASIAAVAEMAALLTLHAVQLHGDENAEYVASLRRELPRETEIWKAVSVGRDPLRAHKADRLLFDNGGGGTGRTFDWSRIGGHADLPRAIVAGGIGPHNAREARELGSHAIDVGSALDEQPGAKSPQRIRALFDALRQPCRQEIAQCA